MSAGERERRESTLLMWDVDRAYLVRGHDLLFGLYPLAEPIVLVDPALAHLHPACRQLEILEPPKDPEEAPATARRATALPRRYACGMPLRKRAARGRRPRSSIHWSLIAIH